MQRAAWAGELKDDKKFFKIFEENFAANKTDDSIVARVRKTMIDETPLHVRLNSMATDALPHHWRWDEVYDKTPMLHITIPEAPPWDEQYKRHLPRLETEIWEGVSIFLFMEAEGSEKFNERVERFLEEHGLLS